ncbi:unnamed protein product [Pleuronectes platessa]|uniref:Uncharacterized protein n=1 Tax=Pleuronectes platessa TaxID=8262 RepID=A0A9N7UAQ1_PLEPL|nr:unnamed protein product [Pleuronectes platessa]
MLVALFELLHTATASTFNTHPEKTDNIWGLGFPMTLALLMYSWAPSTGEIMAADEKLFNGSPSSSISLQRNEMVMPKKTPVERLEKKDSCTEAFYTKHTPVSSWWQIPSIALRGLLHRGFEAAGLAADFSHAVQ